MKKPKQESFPEDPKAYYQMWIKILEGHYMTLFQSPDYVKTLGEGSASDV